MDFITAHNLTGLLIGILTFVIIGVFHPIVIKAEYYIGVKSWWIFLLLGIFGIGASIYFSNVLVSSACGVFAFSSLWSIGEVFEQRKRVAKGWFPVNPNRKQK